MKGAHLENPEIQKIPVQTQSIGAALVAVPLWLPPRITTPLTLARSQPV